MKFVLALVILGGVAYILKKAVDTELGPSNRSESWGTDDPYDVGLGINGWRNLRGVKMSSIDQRWHDSHLDIPGKGTGVGIKLRDIMPSEIIPGDLVLYQGTLRQVQRAFSTVSEDRRAVVEVHLNGNEYPVYYPRLQQIKGIPSWEV